MIPKKNIYNNVCLLLINIKMAELIKPTLKTQEKDYDWFCLEKMFMIIICENAPNKQILKIISFMINEGGA